MAEDPDCIWPALRAKELWRQEEEKKERWKDWQERVWHPRMLAFPEEREPKDFTQEELERMLEHFSGANDPVAQSIYLKASRTLSTRNKEEED